MTADEFFLSRATVLVGQACGADALARKTLAGLSAVGLCAELAPCLEHGPILVSHMGVVYGVAGGSLVTAAAVDDLLATAVMLRAGSPGVPRAPAPRPPRRAAPGADLQLLGRAEAAAKLPPMVGKTLTLARRGDLVWGNWWLHSLGAEALVLAGEFGLAPPVRGAPPEKALTIEVWPADVSGKVLAVGTTMVHVPFGGAARLRLVGTDADPLSGARRRTDGNLRGVFG